MQPKKKNFNQRKKKAKSLQKIISDRRYIEQPLKPAPPPIVTVRSSNTSSSSHSQSNISSSTTKNTSSNYSSSSSNVNNTKSSYSSSKKSSTETSDKTSTKKYGGKLDKPGSPSRSRSATKELILPPDDSLMCKPEFTKLLKDLKIRDSETLTLNCSVKGDPEPQVTWSKNGKAISSSEVVDLKYKNGVATLVINEIFPEDEGTYVCTATNSIGSTETKCNLIVERK